MGRGKTRLSTAIGLIGLLVLAGALASPQPARAQAQTFTTLYNFCSQGGSACTDGELPVAPLIQGSDGNFYGTAQCGGSGGSLGTGSLCYDASGTGTVFRIAPSGALITLHNFCSQTQYCTDGAYPRAPLTQGSDGNFYGTTFGGGAIGCDGNGCGTVYKIAPSGNLDVLYDFCSQGNCTDGSSPIAGLVQGSDGNFYGTTWGAGPPCHSTAFKITPSGTLTTLYSFCSESNCPDGRNPVAGLDQGSDGNFYGTTPGGGANSNGTVFKITPAGAFTKLWDFCSQGGSNCTDGALPEAGLLKGTDGNFYGTTNCGGTGQDPYNSPCGGLGTVFKISSSGTLTTLYNFCSQGFCTDGANPQAGLVQGTDGNFYGTTFCGGNDSGFFACGPGAGTVFSMTPSGALTTLYDFCSQSPGQICLDGAFPSAALLQAGDGNFYGTTQLGGDGNAPFLQGGGIVFNLNLAPVASLSPTSLTFGPQDVGTTSPPQTVTLSNTGEWPLTISAISTSAPFAETNNCNGSLAAGANCTINVTYTPTQTGTQSSFLIVTDNSNGVPNSEQAVSLTGTGINPGGTVSPTSLAFGNQVVNTTSAIRKVTLTSSGTSPLMNIGFVIAGANYGDFAQTNNCPSTLSVGSKCTINVTFTPSIIEAESATLEVDDNAADSPQLVALTGTGILPASLSPPSVNFGNVPQATSSAPRNFILRNNQSTGLGISSIGFTGANANDFSYGGTCGSSLPAKSSCTISVTFTPSLIGAESAALTVNENAPPGYNTLTSLLSGTGIVQVTLKPASITFPAQKVGTTSSAHNATLHNNLSSALPFTVSFTGADPGDFAATNNCSGSVPGKSSCTISVTFTPQAKGTRTATLNVNDSANNSPQQITLTGTGK